MTVDWEKVASSLLPSGVLLSALFEMTPAQLAATLFERPTAIVDPVLRMREINDRRAARGERPVWSKPLRDQYKR